jgi:hypothetical protein
MPAVGAASVPPGSTAADSGTVYGHTAGEPGAVALISPTVDLPGRYPPGYNAERTGRAELEQGPSRPRNQRRL